MKNHLELENVSPKTNAVDSQQTEGRRTIIYDAVRRRHQQTGGFFLLFLKNKHTILFTKIFIFTSPDLQFLSVS